jgi:ketosteroid isomerase-like protein
MFRTGEIVRGQDAIRDLMTPAFTNPTYSLSWEPEFAEISLAGDLGYTIGRYESWAVAQSGDTLTSTGRYVTIWRKDAEGEWKAVLDIGSPAEGG